MASKNKVLAVVGPTGSGKTNLAVGLAEQFGGVLLSADSRQVYRGLDVGTNKEGVPGEWHGQPARFIGQTPQLLIDVAQPGETFTLVNWLDNAKVALEEIWEEKKVPIVVGGTGLYVSALLEGYEPGEGRYSKARRSVNFRSKILMPEVDRTVLNEKSDRRYERIFNELLDETERLLSQGVTHEWLEKIGLDYRFASYFLRGLMNRELAIGEFQTASRQYIRRQLTWWRHHGEVELVKGLDSAAKTAREFLG